MGKVVYPGRFQPFNLRHAEVLMNIIGENPGCEIVVLVADWSGERTKENPFSGAEASGIVSATLLNLGVRDKVTVQTLKISMERSLPKALGEFIRAEEPAKFYSGSENTLAVLDQIGFPGEGINRLVEDQSAVHSTQIREMMAAGDERWKYEVYPMAAMVIESVRIDGKGVVEALNGLPSAEKRRWAKGSERR